MSKCASHVFISYHRADVAIAEQVRTHLVANGVSTWMDQYDIPAGAYWPDEIDKGLGAADLVVGLLSPDAVDSRNVKNEWDWALQNGKQLILLMTRPCVVPHRYVSINFIDATSEDPGAALETLMRTAGIRPAEPNVKVPRTRYALSGGLNVAWQEFGSGDVDIVYVPGFISHVEHSWKHPAVAGHLARFGTLGRILKFDKCGTGMSDRAAGIPTLEERTDDIRAVMDAAGSERAVLYGLSEGVPLSILFAATYPERTQGLILSGGSATYVSRPDYPWQRSLEEWQQQIANDEATLADEWGTLPSARKTLAHYAPSATDDDELVAWFAEFARLAASPGAAIALDRMNLEVDVRSILPAVRVPTLIVHRVGELEANIGEARYIAQRIPGAELRELPGNDHLAFIGDQDPYFDAIERFLATLGVGDGAEVEPDSVLATVVRVAASRGDLAKFRPDLDRLLNRFRGQMVVLDDGGLLASFDGSARAIRFAQGVMDLPHAERARIRAGVQTGEVVLDDSGATGPPVEIATRLAELALPGQLLATGTVRDLVAGSGIRFQDATDNQPTSDPDSPPVLIVERESV